MARHIGVGLGLFLLIHFPARLLVHLAVSRGGLRDFWPHPLIGPLVANVLLLVSFVLIEGTIIARVSEPRSVDQAIRIALRRLPSLLAARVLYFAAVAAGLVLFIVPGVIVAVLFVFHSWLVVVDGETALRSLARSAALVKGRIAASLKSLLPATFAAAVWLVAGFALTGFLLRAIRPFPVFKIAPLTMTLTESAVLLPMLAVGILFARYRANLAGETSPDRGMPLPLG